ncbi:DEAD/DEAH box helicase [Clostridium oryzae]|uniref:RNA polymerase-associated protein RapA n=1 Tax=Clostridium oryzae TaxID=1450648 RepID=A0A1V4IX14_9CLOT|nr:DEAD/DEAH box helicase [Clostridium oryzae]OPJ64449.1 RNA polymerase-associated protein RapA [Clostridium oryzae]
MKLNELKLIFNKSASNAIKKEGKEIFDKGLVTHFKGKKIDEVYHIYGKVKDKSKFKEINTHLEINLKEKKIEEAVCSCGEFRELSSSGYMLKCRHLTATVYKFFSLLSKNKNQVNEVQEIRAINKEQEQKGVCTARLVRKTEKDSVYYEGQSSSRNEKRRMHPNELKTFLEKIENRKIRFKFEYIEFVVPILHKDLPLTFNLKEDAERIVLTTHKQLPIPLNSNHDVYYFRNELYLPSKSQTDKYAALYEKLKEHGEISYRKNINNYNKLISILSSISHNINISEGLKNFVSDLLRPEFYIFEQADKIYCDVFLNYGNRKINILHESENSDTLIRDYKKEEKLLMKIEKSGITKMKDRFMFTGGEDELFNILSGRRDSIKNLGNIILGNGLKDKKIYSSAHIKADLDEIDGYYDFSYSIGNLEKEELKSAFKAYRSKKKFYKTKNNDFLDFEDDGVKSFFNLIEVLRTDDNTEWDSVKLEKSKALYLYENIKNSKLGFFKNSEELNEIENKLININNRGITLPDGFNGTLREYQLKGFKWLKTLSEVGFGGILADEMGLGKTIQTIAFLLSEQEKKTIIICPTSLIYNWKDEFQKFAPDLKVLIVHGSDRNKAAECMNEYEVILTTYGTLKMDIDNYSNFIFDYCIIDEAQNVKNASAQNTKAVKQIKAKTRFALTGTPIENNLTELWSIFDYIMPGYLYTKEKFEEKFIDSGDENLENLKLLIQPFILRRTKKEVVNELPDKIEKKLLVRMTAAQKAVYSSYIKRVKTIMKNNVEGKIEIFSYLTKLRQICLDPSLIVEKYEGGSGKLEVAMELIKEHTASGGKVLLFSQFTSVLDKIGERLNKEKLQFFHLDGRTKPKDRIERVKEFNNSNSVKVFLISLKAGGTGLNLTAANLVIHFDPWWNPAVEDQATDRAHRIGQTDIVEVIKLVAKGTIEEKIILLQEDKKELINNILTGELKNSSLLSSLSREDLLQLFDRD